MTVHLENKVESKVEAKVESKILEIRDSKAAEVLLNPASLKQLEPFLGTAKSVSQAAAELGDKANSVLARVKRFLALGLLVQSHEEARAGRPIKYYMTPADIFYIPFEITSASTLVEALEARDSYWQHQLTTAVVHARARHRDYQPYGTRIYKDKAGRLQLQSAHSAQENYSLLDDDAPAALSLWRDSLYLDNDDAKALQQELFQLFQKYHSKKGKQRYLLRLGLVSLED